jgi:hypothetical protein
VFEKRHTLRSLVEVHLHRTSLIVFLSCPNALVRLPPSLRVTTCPDCAAKPAPWTQPQLGARVRAHQGASPCRQARWRTPAPPQDPCSCQRGQHPRGPQPQASVSALSVSALSVSPECVCVALTSCGHCIGWGLNGPGIRLAFKLCVWNKGTRVLHASQCVNRGRGGLMLVARSYAPKYFKLYVSNPPCSL